ncbi:MAG: LamB/YcsF family protein [Chitinophagaceae bacterium]|nr:LamB/YcsF family protein [Chitinophagaceae bacterium]MBL0055683.1 LamB/YcsF family protein [Chitinophagaceae bacterium]
MIDINCDMGEGLGNEESLMPYIRSANIACGFHAGDQETMDRVVALCLRYKVNIGAHPSFPDKPNFGRTNMYLTAKEVYTLVTEQLLTIDTIVKKHGAILHHVKPHGALYNMAARDGELASAIALAVKDFDASLVYYGLSRSLMIQEAEKAGLQTAHEVFADRSYQTDGSLTPRTLPGALLETVEEVLKQVVGMVSENRVTTLSGEKISIRADTICIHGDGPHALEFARSIHQILYEK